MYGYLVSLLMGVAVGALYGLVRVHSPAPPLIALVGLLGMVLGEQATDTMKRHLVPPPVQTASSQPGGGQKLHERRLPDSGSRH